jgi:uncharacterized protein
MQIALMGGSMFSAHHFFNLGAVLLSVLVVTSPASAQATNCHATDGKQINGAYRFDDGTLASILPTEPNGHHRITHFGSGKSHRLSPSGDLRFQSGGDFDSTAPVVFRYQVKLGKDGLAESLTIEDALNTAIYKQIAKKIRFAEEVVTFKSGDTELFGKLTLPASEKSKFKTVIFVHGSDKVASVDQEWLPHLMAANGIATFVFDKRGSGCSKGEYVQHFDVLANDVTAAVSWLKTKPAVDKNSIGLVGFSQGGWVAPLAALKEPTIKFAAIGFGLTMSMADEDRLEAPLKLKEAGIDNASIAEYQELNAALHKGAREKFKDWRELETTLEKFKDKPWIATAKSMQSWVGVVLQMGVPQAKQVAPPMFEHFFQPFYEPVPTLEKLNIPMLWLIAEKDIEAPPELTIETLKRLRQQGKPFTTVVFPNADHGLQEFELRDGKRVRTKYAQHYFSTLLQWVQRQK